MSTRTEPAALLTVEPTSDKEGRLDYEIFCRHGAFRFEAPAELALGECIDLIVGFQHAWRGCHCADAIRARYGAGGEGGER